MSISKINNSKNDYRNDIYNDFNKNKTRNKNQNKKIPKTKSQNIIHDINININNTDKKSLNNKSYSVNKDNNDKNPLYINNSFINKNRNNKSNLPSSIQSNIADTYIVNSSFFLSLLQCTLFFFVGEQLEDFFKI